MNPFQFLFFFNAVVKSGESQNGTTRKDAIENWPLGKKII